MTAEILNNAFSPPINKKLTICLLQYALDSFHLVAQHRAILACDILLEIANRNNDQLFINNKHLLEEDRILLRVQSIISLIHELRTLQLSNDSDDMTHHHHHHNHHLNRIISQITKQRQIFEKEGTSYDWMIKGCLERYSFHPYTAHKYLTKALKLSPCNYEVYIYLCNLLNSEELDRRIDSIKCLQLGVVTCDYVLSVEYDEYYYRRISADRLVMLGRIEAHHSKGTTHDPSVEGSGQVELQCYERALEIDPTDFHAVFYMGFFYGFTSSHLAQAFPTPGMLSRERQQAFEKSIVYFKNALKVLDENKKIIFQSIIFNNIAAMQIQLQQFDDAMQWYDKTLELNKRMGWAIRDRSFCLRNLQKIELAIQNYDYCINVLQPESPRTRSELVVTKSFWEISQQGIISHARLLTDLTSATEMDPSSCFSWYLKSVVLNHNNKVHLACVCLDQGVKKCGDRNPNGLVQLLERRAECYATLQHIQSTAMNNNNNNFGATVTSSQVTKLREIAQNYANSHMRIC